MSNDLAQMERESGRHDDEPWIDWHHRMYDAMVKYHREKGEWTDPVSRRKFPEGRQMVRDPNRTQRRNLDAFRRSSKRN